jgi:excinuclease ABC subunit C
VKTDKAAWLKMSLLNAQERLNSHLSDKETQLKRMQALQQDLQLSELPERLECFDISHTAGEGTVASCVVFDQSGPRNSDYRRFNIEGITGGDDYEAMAQAVMRRYKRLRTEDAKLPDLIIIDGGPGQINRARAVLEELQISESLLLSVAKGASRKFGRETFYQYGQTGLVEVRVSAPAFGLIAHIRDEAHRFAIAGHRAKRSKKRLKSALEGIPGVGPKRRRLLLTHFGGIKGLRQASVEEIAKLPGVSNALAERILEELKVQ